MDDMWILAIVLSAEAFVFILVMLYSSWKLSKVQREWKLKKFIAQSIEDWPVERALNEWLETATTEGLAKYTLDDWLKAALTNWQVKDVLRKQIREVVEVEVRRQLLDANLKAA